MKPLIQYLQICIVLTIAGMSVSGYGADVGTSPTRKLDLAGLKTVPDGNYLVTLEWYGKQVRINLSVQDNRGKCVNSSEPTLRSAQVSFESYPRQEGAFVARLRSPEHLASQLWIFRKDGIAAIRETPDRGEIQSAVPVAGTSIESPK